ncbi:MAG: helix-turn-helix transcriptional regulator [Colwellia sp.]|nr:helix-turn-helix transcriptional regulator [Colwellia sp.]
MTPKQFKTIRTKLGLTQKALAEALGYKTTSVSSWEQGRRPIGPRVEKAVTTMMRTSFRMDAVLHLTRSCSVGEQDE